MEISESNQTLISVAKPKSDTQHLDLQYITGTHADKGNTSPSNEEKVSSSEHGFFSIPGAEAGPHVLEYRHWWVEVRPQSHAEE